MGNRSRTPLTLGVLVLTLCALVAASGGGLRWTAPDGAPAVRESTTADEDSATPERGEEAPEDGEAEQTEGDDDPRRVWLPSERLFALLLLAALAVALVAVASQLRLMWRRRLDGGRDVEAVDLPADLPDEDADDVLGAALGAGLDHLGAGSARNAIVAAWLRLEDAAESEHFARDPADTPSEFVARVLASYSLDAEAIERLAALYREARFSRHELGQEHRAEAGRCLATLLAGLRAARATPGGRP